jgi:2-polyprenyl-3-methyl-5-hydroxy-6-metoxy-1,4-benzoquinol methylase
VTKDAETAWDREYERGRYHDEPPVAFVDDILQAVRVLGLEHGTGLYIGCGNGRNYVPLIEGGLDLIGLDISGEAISQLRERLPQRADRLVQGDLRALPSGHAYDVVIGIQVFQHGDRREAHDHLALAKGRVAPGGLFCLRVNAVETDVWRAHEVVEEAPDDSFTVRYLDGPKNGLLVHFFSRQEIEDLFVGWPAELPLRLDRTSRASPERGQWSQWEGIWRSAT